MAEHDIARIAAQADLPAIASNFTAVKPKGREYIATCVFHSPDKNPSLTFFQKSGKWQFKCHACGEGGDAIDWIEKLEGLDTAAAAKRLNGGNTWKANFKAPPKAEPLKDRITSKPPEGAASPDFGTRHLGEPSKIYPIRDVDGSLIAYECRYMVDGKKEPRIWSWGSRGDEAPSWAMGHLNTPRPLYGLHRLSDPHTMVLITEGPKKAEAGSELLSANGYASISFTGGANAWHKHDFTPISGKSVLIFPDADEPGIAAGDKLAELLADPRGLACTVRIIDPRGMPEGWDIADALADGWDTKQLIAWAKPRARDYHHIVELQHGMSDDLPPLEAYHSEQSVPSTNPSLPPVSAKPKDGERNVVGEVFYRRMADIESKAIRWLWPGRIAKGKVSMIVGNPGLGKSQVCASIASIVSNGSAWPVGREPCEVGSIVFLSAEDDPEDTIRPRLEAAGADLTKIFILDAIRVVRDEGDGKRGFDLSVDISKLAALLSELRDAALVVIDPITAYLGDADSHKNAEVRALLAPLSEMAAAHGVAVVAVSHLTKSSGMEALLRVQGSIGFAAAARAVWGVAKDKDNQSRRLFMPLKNNLGTDVTGFAYSVEGLRLPDSDIETSHVMWESQAVTITADEAFAQSEDTHDDREKMLDAKSYLRSLLADGPVLVSVIEIDSRGAGHSWATLRRAQKELNIHAYRGEGIGPKGKWYWRL